jgi:hypothetical protein
MPHSLSLDLLADPLAVCRLDPASPLPEWADGEFVSVTRTAAELSLVCAQRSVPDGVRHEPGWRCFRLAGPIDFAQVGVLAALLVPLAEAGVGVFALSTFDTDYVLVKDADVPRAADSLRRAGHFVSAPLG